ncbi:MAG: TlpA family protein disulfide reductase [Acidobacteria bacterium]|nr:TlpA family protein disulfide reductase [Acidobacteriota bacterium]
MGSILNAALVGCLLASVSVPAFAAGALSNRRAPGFSLSDSNMKQHDPADYRGKILLLEFMQTHCPTCKQQSGVLEQIKAKYGAKVEVLSVVVMPDTIDHVRAYIKDNSISSPILFDCGQMTASYLKITPQNPTVKFPHLFFIDANGTIRQDFDSSDAGSGKVNAKTVAAEIDKLLQGTPQKR